MAKPPSCSCSEKKEAVFLERFNSLSNYSFQWLYCKACFVSAQVLAERSLNNSEPRVLGLFLFDLSFSNSFLSHPIAVIYLLTRFLFSFVGMISLSLGEISSTLGGIHLF